MGWVKLGPVYCANGPQEWRKSHAANPVPVHLGDDEFRVYYGARDVRNRTHITSVDVELKGRRCRVLRESESFDVAPGPPGAFDDSGVSLSCIVPAGAAMYMYYLGWNLGVTVPFRNSIGLAVSDGPGKPFVKYGLAAIMDRDAVDPFSLSYPVVLREGARWRMWYSSNAGWTSGKDDMRYPMKYAESADGVHWVRHGVVLDVELPEEGVLCRPWVVRFGDTYGLWYSHRGRAYRIGYAESPDGLRWRRVRRLELDVSPSGWDSEMVEYPAVFEHAGERYMLYNGNAFGATGFGLAMWEGA